MKVLVDKKHKPIFVVQINRPEVRNAVDGETASLLFEAFTNFAEDEEYKIAILRGSEGHFCSGADLRAISKDKGAAGIGQGSANHLSDDMNEPGPMGPTRLALPKPVIACIDGYAVAGGLELAAWADLRVASVNAKLGVLCRLRGVPLIDGGTYRLTKLIGRSRANDLILTGRLIDAYEGKEMGLINHLVSSESSDAAFQASLHLAKTLCQHPQQCMRRDRLSTLSLPTDHGSREGRGKWNVVGEEREALRLEFQHGLESIAHLGQALQDFVHQRDSKI